MSPGGLITLPAAARKGLGMTKGKPIDVNISTDGKSILLTSALAKGRNAYESSSGGNMLLKGAEKEFLLKSKNRHYWLEIADDKKQVKLLPF